MKQVFARKLPLLAAIFAVFGVVFVYAPAWAGITLPSSAPHTHSPTGTPSTPTGAPRAQPNTVNERKFDLGDTMNFDSCLNFESQIAGCMAQCKVGSVIIPVPGIKVKYREPSALAEVSFIRGKSYLEDEVNPISKQLKVWPDIQDQEQDATNTNLGDDTQKAFAQTKTEHGPEAKYFMDVNVWGISPMARFKSSGKNLDVIKSLACTYAKNSNYLAAMLSGQAPGGLGNSGMNLSNPQTLQAMTDLSSQINQLQSTVSGVTSAAEGPMQSILNTSNSASQVQTGSQNVMSQVQSQLQSNPNIQSQLANMNTTLSGSGLPGMGPLSTQSLFSAPDTIDAILRKNALLQLVKAQVGKTIPIGLYPGYLTAWEEEDWANPPLGIKGNMAQFLQKALISHSAGYLACGGSALMQQVGGLVPVAANLAQQAEAFMNCLGAYGPVVPQNGWSNHPVEIAASMVVGYRAYTLGKALKTVPGNQKEKAGEKEYYNLDYPHQSACYQYGTVEDGWMSPSGTGLSSALRNPQSLTGLIPDKDALKLDLDMKKMWEQMQGRVDSTPGSVDETGGVYNYTIWKETSCCVPPPGCEGEIYY